MTGLLRGCRAKIERADESIKTLNSEISAFLSADPPPYAVTREMQNNAYDYVFTVRMVRPIPDRFAVLAGEVVHHLASSLDHLFAALITRNNKTVEKRHFFPIYTSTKEFRKACEKGLIDSISPSAQEIIGRVQPCHSSAMPRDTILAAVKELNNTDKHRLLIIVGAAAAVGDQIDIGYPGMVDALGKQVTISGLGNPKPVEVAESDVEFFRILLASPAPNFYAKAEIAVQIAFAQVGLTKLVPVPDVMPKLLAGIAHTINEFLGEFAGDD